MDIADLLDWPRGRNRQTAYPPLPGVYALFLNERSKLPDVQPGVSGLLYVGMGQGARGLAARCHFKGNTAGHSPRRSFAALLCDQLGLRPIFIRKPSGATTFKLDKDSERVLDEWMETNLTVALHVCGSVASFERDLIKHWEPPLNCDEKVCPLNSQQSFVLLKRKKLKMLAAHAADASR